MATRGVVSRFGACQVLLGKDWQRWDWHAVAALLECGSRKGPSANFGDHVDKFW